MQNEQRSEIMMIKDINIKIIDHKDQRATSPGDYWYDKDGVLQMRISDTGDDTMNRLILIHEMVEEFISQHQGVDEPTIQEFDEFYEGERELGLHTAEAEPGFDSRSPYRQFHTIATAIEMMLAGHLNVDWNEYDKKVLALHK
jgi:hypothetical protein